MSTLRLLKI